MRIVVDGLSGPEIAAFLQEHLDDMRAVSPPESKHALDLDGLRQPDVTFWSVYDDADLVGCGALKRLDNTSAELKSMRTAGSAKRRGVGSTLLEHIEAEARRRGFARLYLETGTADYFAPARAFYARHGFTPCEPFADYPLDPHSTHMTKAL